MMMMKWIKGDHHSAAKIDPAFATVITIVAQILIRFDLHTKLGLSPDLLLTTLLDIATVALIIRSIQTNVTKKPPATPAVNDEPPAPPAPPVPDENAAA